MAAQRMVSSLVLWSTMVAMAAEATSLECAAEAEETCDDTGLLQKSAKLQSVAAGSREVESRSNATLKLLQWNAGHTKKDELLPHLSKILSQHLLGNFDFFNVVNWPSAGVADLPSEYGANASRCNTEASPEESSTTLIYDQERWVLDQERPIEDWCFKSGAAILAPFRPRNGQGPRLLVVGAHFGFFSTDADQLAANLAQNFKDGREVVFLGDTNALPLFGRSNKGFLESWGLPTDRGQTPTEKATCCYPRFLQVPGTDLYFAPDRIITTLPSPGVPVTVTDALEGLPVTSQRAVQKMHKVIGVTLQLP